MEKITIPIKTDKKGKLITVNALIQIKNYTDRIIFPNIDINNISLSMLTLENGKKCIRGYYIGKKWDGDKWTNGDLELIFE